MTRILSGSAVFLTGVLIGGAIAWMGLRPASPAEPEPPPRVEPGSSAHPPGCSAFAGTVSRELMERPATLRSGAGRLRQAVTTQSPEAQAFYDQGIAYLASYVWTEAARSFHQTLRSDPRLAMAHLGLAKAYLGAESFDDAKSHLDQAQRLADSGSVSPKEKKWIELGSQQLGAIRADAADRETKHAAYKHAIEELIATDPGDAHGWVLRGNAEEGGAWGRGQFGGVGAVAYYEAALERDAEHLGAHHFLAHAYENIGRHATAAEHARVYAAAAHAVPHAQHMYGHMLPRLGRWEEALVQFEAADRLEREYYAAETIAPEEDWHHGHNLQLLGTVHLRLGHVAEAERSFQEAFQLKNRGVRAGAYGAPWIEYLLLRGRFDEALAAASEERQRPSALARLIGAALSGEASLGLGEVEAAQVALDESERAYVELTDELGDTPYATYVPFMADSFVRTLRSQLALSGSDPSSGESALLAMADALAANPRFDAWGEGLLRLSRIAAAALRAERPQLAEAIVERMRRIDPEFRSFSQSASGARAADRSAPAGPG